MKRLVFASALAILLGVCFLYAQTMDLRANVPFDFRVGDTWMPAGLYIIRHTGSSMTVREVSGQHGRIALTLAANRTDAAPDTRLVFNRYGESYFLSRIWIQGDHNGLALPRGKLEKEYAGRNTPTKTASVPALR